MGVLPVPEEVRSMHAKIDRVLDTVYMQNKALEKIIGRLDEFEATQKDLHELSRELRHVKNSLITIKDCLRFDAVS
ncbi:hypothetical protein [Desulfomonile tiedjei]|uniref:Uncharacterized protein n=1 Tax=Desulfomonile tiedjei (strain ATCC 49306 / DSM 6799 / DCB-1) TaxID=706587 RepID=I4CDN3_DESTA|nr:hypothetical protein [Desulfomonile tiedjei]AFM27674.1 hypothetical protein Desti_5064 [Desulfomonile tiedjei DSM 6799]